MIDELDPDVSLEPTLLRELSEEQKARLTEQLDLYLRGLESGEPVDAKQIADENPDLSEVFLLYLGKLDALHGFAGRMDVDRNATTLLKNEGDIDDAG